MPKDVQRSFRLPASLDAELVATAETLDRSVSWVVVRTLELALLGEQVALGKAVMRGAKKVKR